MNKVIKVILVSVALVSVFALCCSLVSAEELKYTFSNATGGVYVYDTTDGSTDFVTKNIGMYSDSTYPEYPTLIRILHPGDGNKYSGFRINLHSQGFVKVQSGYYFTYSMVIKDNYALYGDFNPRAYVITSDDTIYELNVSWAPDWTPTDSDGQEVVISIGGRVGDGTALHFGTLVLDFQGLASYSSGTGAYILYCSSTVRVVATPEQVRHDELKQEIQQATDDITEGWTTDSTVDDDISSKSDEMNDLESDALGGKSDEQIKEELDNTLSGEGMPDVQGSGVIAVSQTFDDLLDVFGPKYQSLLILALTLGLAALLVGRSFRAKGD